MKKFLDQRKLVMLSLLLLFFVPTLVFAKDWDWNWKNINPKPQKLNTEKFEVESNELAVFDLNSGTILYEKDIDKPHPIASITKLMTSVILLENFEANEVVSVSYRAALINGSKMHLQANESITNIDLVYGLMVSSANDAAAAIEDFYGKEKIVAMMNKKAQELGLKNTKYSDAIGLDPGNLSSARDLYFLSKYAFTKPEIKKAANLIEHNIVSVSGFSHNLKTTNRLLKNYPDIYGLKTGYTEEAGNCLIACSVQSDHHIISIMLGAPDYDLRFSDSRSLLDWIFRSYKW